MESRELSLDCAEGEVPLAPHQVGSGSSSGTGYYTQKNGEWRNEKKMLDITRDKPVKVCVRVVVPVRDHPKFNFVGKLLGPKGNSLKRLQEDTMCKMAVLGRGSMKDRQKEEELRVSGDPKFAHLSEELHVEISAFATPAEAHARIAYALAELRRFLVPDYNDDIRQEQMLEMQILSSQTEQQRQLTPPDSRSGSEETLPLSSALPLPRAADTHTHTVSPPAPVQAAGPHEVLQAHAHHPMGHGLLVGAGASLLQQPQPPHHILTQNTILGGGDLLGLGAPVLGGVVNHPALRGLKPAAVHALAPQGAAGSLGSAGAPVSGAGAGAPAAGAGAAGRKRPLLGGARAAISPTKRTVMTLLARARAAHSKHRYHHHHQHSAILPLIRDEFMTGVGMNVNLA